MDRLRINHVSVEMMLVIGCAILVYSQSVYTEAISSCDTIQYNNYSYEKEILMQKLHFPQRLTIDYDTDTLFFSHVIKIKYRYAPSGSFLNLKTNKYTVMSKVDGGYAYAIDNHNCVVYLGGVYGIYKFDYDTETAQLVEKTNYGISKMFFKKHVIYTMRPNANVYVFKDGRSTVVPELVGLRAAVVAQNNNLDYYFSNSSGLFTLKRVNGEIVSLGDYHIRSMATDDRGNLYFSTAMGIYYINENDEVLQFADIDDVWGLAIESDKHIIYSTQDSIVRLKPANHPCSSL